MARERLYDLAFQYKDAKLWQKLYDTEIFGVRLPSGEIGYCCVMGMMGDQNSFAVYRGDRGFASYRAIIALQEEGLDQPSDEFELLLSDVMTSQDCLMLSLENKDVLSEEEVAEVRTYAKAQKRTLRGKNSFPQLQEYRCGRFPRQLQSEELEQDLCAAIEGALEMNRLLETEGQDAIDLIALDEGAQDIPLLEKSERGEWELRRKLLPEGKRIYPKPKLENDVLAERVRKLAKKGEWHCGCVCMQAPYLDEEEPEEAGPIFPVALLTVDSKSGMVLTAPLGNRVQAEKLLQQFAEYMVEEKTVPRRIRAGDDRAFAMLSNFCENLGISLMRKDNLPLLREAQFSMLEYMEDGDEWDEDEEDWDEDDSPFMSEKDQRELREMSRMMMTMSDRELKQMPREAAQMMVAMAAFGLVPEELSKRLRRIFKIQ